MIMKDKKIKSGFTLVEALVAISILMVAVAAPLTIAQKGLLSAIYAKNQMISAFLAQDAIEFIKNVRDTNGVNAENGNIPTGGWLASIPCVSPQTSCNVDSLNGVPSPADVHMSIKRKVADDNTDGLFLGYVPVGSPCPGAICTATNFTRQVTITQTEGNLNEAYVDVLVSWGTGADQQFRIGSYIYNYWGNL